MPLEMPPWMRRALIWLRTHHLGLITIFLFILLPLGVFGLLAEDVLDKDGFWFDEPIQNALRSITNPSLDKFMVFMSIIGFGYGVVPADIGVALFLAVKRKWGDLKFWAIAIGGGALLNIAAKRFFNRERPDLWESIAPEHTLSFPSGHAMGSCAFVIALWVLLRPTKWWRPVLWIGGVFIVLVGVSRIYLGVHFPSDIAAGWLAATAWVVGVSELLYGKWAKPTETAQPVANPLP